MSGEPFDWDVRGPHPRLRHVVHRYIGYRQHNVSLAVHRGLPSRHVTMIISLADPVRVIGLPDPLQAPIRLQGLVGGLHTAPALIAQDWSQSGIHVELEPFGLRALLGLSAAELSGQVVDLAELGNPRLAALPDRLHSARDWPECFDILDEVLSATLPDETGTAPEVEWAWQQLLRAGGTMRVDGLAREVGWSRRHFADRFRRHLGLSPKQAGRVVRFERSCRVLRRAGRVDLAELALRCGYYDQAHLTNEWRALAGCSPTTWIAEELPAAGP